MSHEEPSQKKLTMNSNATQDSSSNDTPPPEQEYDRYKDHPELLAETMPKASRMFSFDWASGFLSPFRPTPVDILSNLLQHVHFSSPGKDTLLDLGCGDGLVLLQALRTFPSSQLSRAIGVDLDLPLLEASRDKILSANDNDKGLNDQDASDADTSTDDQDTRSRLELYHGDLTAEDEPLTTVLCPPRPSHAPLKTMKMLLQESSHLFVYLLPEALSKLTPLLLNAIESEHKIVCSMRWSIEGLDKYLVQGGSDQQFYIYAKSPPL